MLDFRIETFLCVCKHMSYTKAAAELSITQPAVSGHIRFIEKYYQVKLFEYKNKVLTLTKEGESLRKGLETMAIDVEHLKERVSIMGQKKPIYIGATKSIGDYILSDRLTEFIDRHQELSVSLYVDDTKNLFQMMDDGEMDFFFCEGQIDKHAYEHKFILNESMRCVCAAGYHLPEIHDISDLFGERLILREPGSGTRGILVQALIDQGYNIDMFRDISTMNSPALILQLVERGSGITFIYDSVCNEAIADGRLREIHIPGFQILHEYNAVWRKGSLFTEEMEGYVKELL